MGEAQSDEPGRRMDLVALTVAGLLGRGPVVGEAVGLDDEPEVRPVEVDAVAVDAVLGQRLRQAGGTRELEKRSLQR